MCNTLTARTIYIKNLNDARRKITVKNTKYILTRDIDLKGESLQMPQNATLVLRRGLNNGMIKGNNTSVVLSGKLSNVSFDGSFNATSVSYRNFGDYKSDTELLRAMFKLSLSGTKESVLELEPNRKYSVTSKTLSYAHAIYEFEGIANKTVKGNNATINDLRTRKQVGYKTNDGVFLFSSCSDITIDNLHYQNLNEDFEPVYNDDKSLRYAKGIENQIGYIGTSFILIQRDCSGMNIKSTIKGARYGVKVGDYSQFWICGNYGIKNSTIDVTAYRTGYPVAIELGDSLSIKVVSDTHHRAAYLCGLSNSTVDIRAKNIMIAPLHCLLSDTHYSNGDKTKPKFKSCYNLKVKVVDTGSTIVTNDDAYCVGFQTYNTEPFASRTKPLTWKNITVTIKKEQPSPNIGLFSFSRSNPTSSNCPLAIKDVFDSIHITATDEFGSKQYAARLRTSNVATYRNISFVVNAPSSNVICDNANNYEFDFSDSRISTFYYAGNLKLKKGNAQREKKMDSSLGVKYYKLNK